MVRVTSMGQTMVEVTEESVAVLCMVGAEVEVEVEVAGRKPGGTCCDARPPASEGHGCGYE